MAVDDAHVHVRVVAAAGDGPLRRVAADVHDVAGAGGEDDRQGLGKGDVGIGVRPAMMLDLTKLELIGGSGTLEDPWLMKTVDSQ